MIAGFLAATGLTASALMSVAPAFAGDQLTIVSWGGAYQAALRKAYFEPFTKTTGIKIADDEWNGEAAKVRAMVDSKAVSWDVIDGGTSASWALCTQGMLETIDWKRVGIDRAKFGSEGKLDCGVPFQTNSSIVAYDKDKLPNGPKTIADLFDTKKFPGKRGLWKNPYITLEWALIADDVPTNDVYRVLGTQEGIDRAFRKLDTIKKDVVWWTSGAQPVQLLADGQVVMTMAYHGRIFSAVKDDGKHFEMMWDAAPAGWGYFVIPKGSPHLDDAYKFLAFISKPQPQADLTRYIPYGPSNRDAMALVDPAVLPFLPNTPEHEALALDTDQLFWIENGDDLRQRFTAWLAK
ncbi:ABC transporter substrate-binding protein [Bradyrhizobium japonicum]|uniref:ABC transporter substrate-binding protein n=1 Tax=Bradyrhizobium japonicum TaxID=375 RepID=UPI0004B34579|nr:ABC transporter substrate-binding protein [Bradyrhizobium japonicum]